MPVPSPRNAVKPARGDYSDLSTNISSLKDGEICYAIDQDQLYINESGTLVPAGVTVSGVQTVTGNKTFSGDVDLTGVFKVDSTAVTATAIELNYTGDLGTFTGSTIADNSNVKVALQAIETAVESGGGGGGGSLTADDAGTANYSSGTINISGDTGISTTASGNTLTIDLDDTAVTAASYGAAGTVGTFTVDEQGRLTSASDVSISIAHSQVSDFDSGVQANRLDQMAVPTASVNMNSQKITGLADPVSDQDAATKSYADALVSGLDIKKSTRVATTANITLSNTQTVDNVSLVAGNRVLVKDQTDASENGIYDVVSGGGWTRSSDADNTPSGEVTSGMFTFVEDGDTSAGIGYVLVTSDPITLGTTDLTFTQFSEIGAVTAGNGLTKTGQTLDVGTADSGRIVVNADNIDLAVSGVTAGTYNGFTVDTYGRATAFSQPTTLAGYGITDALSSDSTIDGGTY
jgi:phage-related tail fiber protein